jgi:hypothetical protein
MSHSSRPVEQEAVVTTIVGGRPPGCGCAVGPIPRGIEVLTKKAAVDPDFRQVLLNKRAAAADEIGLTLSPSERLMLGGVPAAQLEAIIANTRVSPSHLPAFLGKVAALMLAALGVAQGPDVQGGAPPIQPDKDESGKDRVAASTRPTTDPSTTPMIGVRIERPQAPPPGGEQAQVIQRGIRPVRPPASQPATTQAAEPSPAVQVVIGARVELPVAINGLTAVRPQERDDMPLVVIGLVARRDRNNDGRIDEADDGPIEVAGARATRVAGATTGRSTTTRQVQPVQPAAGVRPEVIKGARVDRVERVQPQNEVRPEVPERVEVVWGIRIDRPTTKPTTDATPKDP